MQNQTKFKAHCYSQQACAPMFLRLTFTVLDVIQSGTLLCGVATRNSAPIPSSIRSRNSTRIGAIEKMEKTKNGFHHHEVKLWLWC